MNKLLQVNRKLLLSIIFLIILAFIVFLLSKDTDNFVDESIKESKGPNFDILNPSFTINNKQKISVKAERGNFISDKKILLENNVIFKSSKFNLQTNKAIYNKSNQTAQSEEYSKFESDKTIIVSEGFEITNNGNVIFFNGKTKLNLKK